MLELVRYLTSRAREDADEGDEVMHWLLCWFAYPLQHSARNAHGGGDARRRGRGQEFPV